METHALAQISLVFKISNSVNALLVTNYSTIAELSECLVHADPGLTL